MTIRGGFMGRLQGREGNYRLADLNRQAMRMLWKHTIPYKGQLLLASLAMLVVTATTLAMPYLSKVAIDRYVAQRDLRGLALTALVYVGLNGVYWMGAYCQRYLSGRVGQHIVYSIRRALYHHVLRQSMAFHEQERVGQITSRLTNDVNELSEFVSGGLINLVGDILTLVGIIIVMLMLSAPLTMVTLISVPVVMVSMGYLGKRMRRAYRQVRQELAAVNTGVEQGVSGMRVVQSLSQESFTVEQFETLSLRNMKANLRVSLLFAAVFPTMTITNTLGTVLVLGYGGTLAAKGAITIGVLLAFLSYVNRFFGPLREMSLVYNTFQSAAASLDRIADYMNRQPELTESPHPVQPKGGFEGAVAFTDVTFGYGKEPVLHGLDLHIDAGETIALVGPTERLSICREHPREYPLWRSPRDGPASGRGGKARASPRVHRKTAKWLR